MMCFFQSWCVCYVTAIVSAILEMALTGFKLVFWKSMAVLSTPKLVYIPWIIYNAFILNASVKMSLETTNCLLPFKSNNHLCSVQSCPTVCDPMDCSTPGLPVHHQLPEFAQTHVHWVGDAIQPSHPLLSPSPTCNLSQHGGLFQWVSSSHQVAQVLEFQLQHQAFYWIFRIDFL